MSFDVPSVLENDNAGNSWSNPHCGNGDTVVSFTSIQLQVGSLWPSSSIAVASNLSFISVVGGATTGAPS